MRTTRVAHNSRQSGSKVREGLLRLLAQNFPALVAKIVEELSLLHKAVVLQGKDCVSEKVICVCERKGGGRMMEPRLVRLEWTSQ